MKAHTKYVHLVLWQSADNQEAVTFLQEDNGNPKSFAVIVAPVGLVPVLGVFTEWQAAQAAYDKAVDRAKHNAAKRLAKGGN